MYVEQIKVERNQMGEVDFLIFSRVIRVTGCLSQCKHQIDALWHLNLLQTNSSRLAYIIDQDYVYLSKNRFLKR